MDVPHEDEQSHEDYTPNEHLNPLRELAPIVLILRMILERITFEVAHKELGAESCVNDESEELENDAHEGDGSALRVW